MVFKFATHEYFPLTEDWDRSPSSIVWSKDGKRLYLTVEEHGHIKLFELPFRPSFSKKHVPKPLVTEHSLIAVYHAGDSLLLSQTSLTSPSLVQLYDLKSDTLHPLSSGPNTPISSKSVQEFWFPGFERRQVHGFLQFPENFNKSKKYPFAFLIHGGPQGAWEDAWSTRWNPAVFANAGDGWIVAAINPTGSTGYGQDFIDAIQGNWGTKPCMVPSFWRGVYGRL